MPRILCSERVIEYSVEFKIKVIKLTFELDVKAIDIAKVLNLHPMMIYRWRQEYREGKFVEEPSRRISMTKDSPLPKKNDDEINEKNDEIKRLKKELAAVQKENDFLKKWERYLNDQKNSDLDS
ncbi:MAG: transposase [Oleispira sp.]|nr:transposase [Oleispira sp.]